MSFVQDVVTLKRGAVTSQGDHLPPLAAGQPGHFLGAAAAVPDWQHSFAQAEPTLPTLGNSCHLEPT